MKLIVGLGNPGTQYAQTRHNVGFRVVDVLAEKHGWKWERRGRALIANGTLASEKIVLVKPLTFMNNSGEAVSELLRWYKLVSEDVLVIYDDLDLPVGKIRLRAKGSTGGHNGLSSITHHLHTDAIPRLRVGIGRPANQRMDTIQYVLGTPPSDERISLSTSESQAADAVPLILAQGVDAAMNLLNADPEAQQKQAERRLQQLEKRRLRQEQGQLEKQEQQEPQTDQSPEPL
jgi:peptidyl-tRNA hydrolase, PTH1 family